jgi:hypothetical protein
MTGKSSTIGALAAALVLALPATALGQQSESSTKRSAWCPQASADCGKIGKRPARVPEQVAPRPKLGPTQVTGPYGGQVFRSGSWLMS